MEISLKKSIRNGLIAWVIFFLISFSFGIYDMITGFEGLGLTGINIILTIFGAILITTFFFIFVFCLSLIVYYFKERRIESN